MDLHHARQHLWELAARLFPTDERPRRRWVSGLERKLDAGRIEPIVKVLRNFAPADTDLGYLLSVEADHFERNAERIRYAQFRAHQLFVGSGVIEAGCKTIIAKRLKMSGMFWTVRGR
ncbi:MAG: hypothetical protein HY644_09290 [Acidobacteria bacterium]|nr:hypothetical protein [Acidobacteriota bacterium]